ncbi:uncharacterized protein LOC130645847 [Hydractinia symbiolongicarpus]|uniref:uncharacterized protein LOC130645847 n=1 Tax=Hydractinia symbiolongicarpus TaxID=13093 RepID=UPI00254E210F|nr:uncharacterized protein LOC130645847 [Hydractinia symbiolongicarpus]
MYRTFLMQLIVYVVYSFLNFQEMEDKSLPINKVRTENLQKDYNDDSTESTVATVESKERKTATDEITSVFLNDVHCVEKGKKLQDINEVAPNSTLLNKIIDNQERINASNQSLTFKSGDASSFKPGEIFMVTSYKELKKLLENYYVSTSSVFVTVQKTKEFGCEGSAIDFSTKRISWQDTQKPHFCRNGFDIPFDGVPRINVGNFYLNCQYGSDMCMTAKSRRREKRRSKLEKEIENGKDVVIKMRKPTPSKKCGCPAKISVKQIARFPEYKVSKNTNRRLRESSDRLKKALLTHKESVCIESFYIGKLPDACEHKFHEKLQGGKFFKESIHPDIVAHIEELFMQNYSNDKIKASCLDFVLNKLFYKQKPSDETRRKYNPTGKDITNIIARMRRLCHCSEEQKKRISDFIEQAKVEDEYLNACFNVKYQDSQEVDAESSEDEFFEPDSNGKKIRERKNPRNPKVKNKHFYSAVKHKNNSVC